jgi:hypothetical protein
VRRVLCEATLVTHPLLRLVSIIDFTHAVTTLPHSASPQSQSAYLTACSDAAFSANFLRAALHLFRCSTSLVKVPSHEPVAASDIHIWWRGNPIDSNLVLFLYLHLFHCLLLKFAKCQWLHAWFRLIPWFSESLQSVSDRLCGLVVRVLGFRSGGPGSIPSTTRKKK